MEATAGDAGGEAVGAAAPDDEHVHGQGPVDAIHPHESPWTMTLPLVALAGLSIVGGALNLPFTSDTKVLEHWLHPIVVGSERVVDVSTVTKLGLALLATLVSLAGIAGAAAVYLKHRFTDRPAESEVLRRGWYLDSSISAFMGGPGRALFDGIAWLDRTIVDGAVEGTGTVVRSVGDRLRALQSGFVRSYATLLALGAVLLTAVVVVRGVFL